MVMVMMMVVFGMSAVCRRLFRPHRSVLFLVFFHGCCVFTCYRILWHKGRNERPCTRYRIHRKIYNFTERGGSIVPHMRIFAHLAGMFKLQIGVRDVQFGQMVFDAPLQIRAHLRCGDHDMRRKGVFDRTDGPQVDVMDIDDIRFVYKGEMALGLSVSYATLTSDDSDFMLLLDGIDLKGSVFTINPSFGYFVRDNLCVGARFGYSQTDGTLGNVSLNLGSASDLDLSLSGVQLRNRMTTIAAFVRSFAGIDPKGHFGLFAELELAYKMGTSSFGYGTGESAKQVFGTTSQAKVSLNAGVAVYIFPNVCCTLSFGLGGLQYNKINQRDAEGVQTGSRQASKMLFRLNLADIRIGFNIHL